MTALGQRLGRLTDRTGLQWGAVVLAWLISALTFQLRPIMPIDETRYLSIAWEMWHSGQWWVAHMNGVPYADKPPLLFWLINLGWGVFGVNDGWPRLIMPLASLPGLFQLRRIALSLGYGPRTAMVKLFDSTGLAAMVSLKAAATVLALISTTALAVMLTIMLAPLWPRMDTRQPATLLARIEQQGQPVLWYGNRYQASFQFAGRLTTPLQTLDASPLALCRWRQAHPDGWIIGDSRQLPSLYVPGLARRFPWRARTLLVMPVSALQIATPLFLCPDPL